jgi:hypothetical protein
MGATTPLTMSEVYLQYLEYTHITDILIKYGIIGYFRNVSGILIIYSFIHTSAEGLLEEFNKVSPNLDFTLEQEQSITLNILDITINNIMHSQSGSLESQYLENPQLQTVLFLTIRVIQQTPDRLLSGLSAVVYIHMLNFPEIKN